MIGNTMPKRSFFNLAGTVAALPLRRPLLLLLCLLALNVLFAADSSAGRDKSYTSSIERYDVPNVILQNQEGEKVGLRDLLATDKPVVIDFFYTRCPSISRLFSRNFAEFQDTIIAESGSVRLISISIDPVFDTPRVLRSYSRRYEAKPGWEFLTGARDDVKRVLLAFDVYTPNKARHKPIVLLKSPSRNQWIRVNGVIGADGLLVEYERVRN